MTLLNLRVPFQSAYSLPLVGISAITQEKIWHRAHFKEPTVFHLWGATFLNSRFSEYGKKEGRLFIREPLRLPVRRGFALCRTERAMPLLPLLVFLLQLLLPLGVSLPSSFWKAAINETSCQEQWFEDDWGLYQDFLAGNWSSVAFAPNVYTRTPDWPPYNQGSSADFPFFGYQMKLPNANLSMVIQIEALHYVMFAYSWVPQQTVGKVLFINPAGNVSLQYSVYDFNVIPGIKLQDDRSACQLFCVKKMSESLYFMSGRTFPDSCYPDDGDVHLEEIVVKVFSLNKDNSVTYTNLNREDNKLPAWVARLFYRFAFNQEYNDELKYLLANTGHSTRT